MPTYYYPSTDGTGEFFPPGTSISTAGTPNFQGNQQAPAGSYTVITPLGGTGPGGALQYQATFGYTGQGTGTSLLLTQTDYSDPTANETYGQYPVTDNNGNTTYYPAYFVLTNGAVSPNYSHTFATAGSNTSSNFQPTVGSTTDPTACFAAGTKIKSMRGDIAVEDLVVGDEVLTISGAKRPIRWLGHRTLDCRRQIEATSPIRISAHAFGENRPSRDLFVSPGHAICIDVLGEVLIPAVALVNGSTIQQIDVDSVTYWHVELDSHDILLAENLPAESYLEMGNRSFFVEADVIDLAAGPDVASSQRTHADFCRPFVDGGFILEAVRLLLRQRAEAIGWRSTDVLDMHLLVDGQRLDPVVRGLTARFHLPEIANDVWLVSPTAQPRDTLGGADTRDLGLYIGGLRIDDGFATRDIAIDDPLLCVGFHAVEAGARRWTAARARLPAALWDGCEGGFYLRIELAGRPVPRWTAPGAEVGSMKPLQLAIGA